MSTWDDPALLVTGEPALIRRLRLQQSWYRSEVLGVAPGLGGRAGLERLVGSMVSIEAVAERPALNFFDDDQIATYVDQRVADHRSGGRGLISEDRLRRNLLSSQPMAFSIAAKLRSAPDAPAILSALTGLPIVHVDWVEAEWGPDRTEHLDDNTACDLASSGRLGDGRTVVVGIESKYSEPLERGIAGRPERYDAAIESSDWLGPDFRSVMASAGHNQLCRDLLLVASMESSGVADVGLAMVITMEQDSLTRDAISRVQSAMVKPDRLRWVSWQTVVEVLERSSLAEFGERFGARYLPVEW